jgi:hypothetical protein
VKAVLPSGACSARQTTLAGRAGNTGLAISASLAIDAILAVNAVLPVLAGRAVLPSSACGASRATLTSRAGYTGQPTLPLQARGPSDATIAGDPLLPLGTVSPSADADEIRDTGGKSLAVPEVQIAPLLKILIPNPQQAGMLLIPGIAHGSMAGQAGAVVNQSMNGLDRGKLQNGHEKTPVLE